VCHIHHCRWVDLRRKPPSDRRLALLLYGFPPGVGATGTAALLNVPKSLENLIGALLVRLCVCAFGLPWRAASTVCMCVCVWGGGGQGGGLLTGTGTGIIVTGTAAQRTQVSGKPDWGTAG
jgi:hypothetical protein